MPKERIWDEFTKWAAKSNHPGKIVEYLAAAGWLVHFPLLERFRGVAQLERLGRSRMITPAAELFNVGEAVVEEKNFRGYSPLLRN